MTCLLLGLLFLWTGTALADSFSEELVVTRLPTNNVLSQFRFVITSEDMQLGPNYSLFPRIMAEIVDKHSVKELSLSLGQGRWWADKWGIPPQPTAAAGAHVHAWIDGNATTVDSRWTSLVNSLNGVFCTSLTSIVPTMTASPTMTFSPRGVVGGEEKGLRYGALSRESLCTENLTPWKKLLPCKQSGLTTLLNPLKLYASVYHSMSLNMFSTCEGQGSSCHWRLDLSLTMVSDIDLRTKKLDWDFESLLGRSVTGRCHAADYSQIIVEVDREDQILAPAPNRTVVKNEQKFVVYDLAANGVLPFSVSAHYRAPLILSKTSASHPVSILSALGGVDQHSGMMLTRILNNDRQRRVVFSHLIPWFVQMYYHTLKMDCKKLEGGQLQAVTWHSRSFLPAISRQRPYLIEWDFDLPAASRCEVTFSFDKAHLRLREYPPDANHGMYVPAAVLTIVDAKGIRDRSSAIGSETVSAREQLLSNNSSSGHVLLHSNALLVALPVPDFSMPFNVICFVLTAVSLCFGPLHNFSTKMLIPVNTALPTARKYKKILRVFLLVLLAGACYAQYYDIPLNEVRRAIEKAFEQLKEGFEKMNDM